MDVNIRKTATDTAYVLVGVGVLGFQQAQVKRRDAVSRVSSLRQDAHGTVKSQTDSIVSKATGYAASLGDLGSTVTGTVGSLGSTVSGTVGTTVSSTLGTVGSQVKAGADAARGADPRVWAAPVVGDIQVRVEPVVEQIRSISLPSSLSLPSLPNVSAIPEQLAKTIEVGKARVQGRRSSPRSVPHAVNGDS